MTVMSIIGGAALTPVMGKIADAGGVAHAYLVPVGCFLGVALYALFGSKPEAVEIVD